MVLVDVVGLPEDFLDGDVQFVEASFRDWGGRRRAKQKSRALPRGYGSMRGGGHVRSAGSDVARRL